MQFGQEKVIFECMACGYQSLNGWGNVLIVALGIKWRKLLKSSQS